MQSLLWCQFIYSSQRPIYMAGWSRNTRMVYQAQNSFIMASLLPRQLYSVLPFFNTTNFDFYLGISSLKFELMKSFHLTELQNNVNNKLCTDLNFKIETDFEFNQSIKNLKKKIELSNIGGLNANHRSLIELMCILDLDFDVIVLSEVWSFNISFYNNIFKDYVFYYDLPMPTESNIGGVGVYIKSCFACIERNEFKLHCSGANKVENIWLEIAKGNISCIIGAMYRHPSRPIKQFSESIENTLSKIALHNKPCIVAGDMNIDLVKNTTNKQTSDYWEMLITHNFLPTILMPTRIKNTSATLIDHIYFFQSRRFMNSANYYSGSLCKCKCKCTTHLLSAP